MGFLFVTAKKKTTQISGCAGWFLPPVSGISISHLHAYVNESESKEEKYIYIYTEKRRHLSIERVNMCAFGEG